MAFDPALPPLRQELRIEPGAPLVSGAPSWILFDPVRHLFYQIGRLEMKILSLWGSHTLGRLKTALGDEGLDAAEAEAEIGRVLRFSFANNLTVRPEGDTSAAFASQRALAKREWWKWLVDHYLFIRIPLVKPAAFLERTLHIVAPLWSRAVLMLFGALALLGLLLVSRQWDAYFASFMYFFNLDGLISYGIALGGVKLLHELGHAYTATRFGCRVPAMGVSFLVMMPVLYTDTTGAWRLTSRRQRLLIDMAGVSVEMMVAAIATLAWVFLPDGSLRSAAFILSSSSWVMSLGVNLNPFMRYDGYYVLSDWLGVPNLQSRAFALARWRLRELLFDLGEAPPEDMPQRLRRQLIVYAIAVWIYRLVLFVGIALLVYHMFFKLLGLILFGVEMVVFVMRPIFNEMNQWYARKDRILGSKRGKLLPWITAGIGLLLILPLDRHVSAPAVLAPLGAKPVVAGDPARIEAILVHNGQRVAAGTPLVRLSAPELEKNIALSRINIARIRSQMDRAMSDNIDLSNRAVLERELMTESDGLAGFEARRANLVLRASVAGEVTDIAPDMNEGRWLSGAEVIARVVTPGQFDVEAYASEDDVWRLEQGALARFVPDDPLQPSRRAKLVERASSASADIATPILASTNGGAIAASKSDSGKLKPKAAIYRMRLIVERSKDAQGIIQTVPGKVVISADGTSMLSRMARWTSQLFQSERSLSN